MNALIRPLLALAVAASLVTACGESGTTSSKTAKPGPAKKVDGPVVATVGNAVITSADVQKKLDEQSPLLKSRYKDIKARKDFVQNLIRYEVLAQEALDRGIDQQPEVADTIKKILVQELIKQEFDEKKATFSDEELKDYYEKHLNEFVKPERIRAQHIFVSAAEGDKKGRSAAKAKITGYLKELKANDVFEPLDHPKHKSFKPTLFADLAREHSDDPNSKAQGGDLRYLSADDMSKQYGEGFAKAVFGIEKANGLSAIIETPQGFHVARLTNRQLAVDRKLEDAGVKDTIRGRLFREKKTKSFDEYVDSLKKKGNATINDAELEKIEPSAGGVTPMGSPNSMPVPPPAPVPPPGGTQK